MLSRFVIFVDSLHWKTWIVAYQFTASRIGIYQVILKCLKIARDIIDISTSQDILKGVHDYGIQLNFIQPQKERSHHKRVLPFC